MEGKYMLVSGPVIVEKGKILLAKDEHDDFFKLPGGRVKENEDMREACKRKVKEEINGEIEIKKLLCVEVLWKNPTTQEKETIVLFNWLSKLKNKKNLKVGEDTKEIRWFNLKDIRSGKEKEKISPNTLFAIGFL
jgi:ADP-ribose pyrophosphatase YjhB (NUDIX family)